jgi:chorismate mutase
MKNQDTTLQSWRTQIDELDMELIRLLALRMEKVYEIGKLKKQSNLPVVNRQRQQKVMKQWLREAEKRQLSGDFTKKIYDIIHEYAIGIEANC